MPNRLGLINETVQECRAAYYTPCILDHKAEVKVRNAPKVSCQLLPRAEDCEYLRVLPTVVLTRGAYSVHAMRMYAACVQSMSPGCMLYISRCESSCCECRSLPTASRSRRASKKG